MNELIEQTGNILSQSQELLNNPEIKGAISDFLSWIGQKIFTNKKTKQERLSLIEKQEANEQTINDLKSDIRSIIEDHDELQKELAEKVKDVDLFMQQAGIPINKTNNINNTGNENIINQDINSRNININFKNQ